MTDEEYMIEIRKIKGTANVTDLMNVMQEQFPELEPWKVQELAMKRLIEALDAGSLTI